MTPDDTPLTGAMAGLAALRRDPAQRLTRADALRRQGDPAAAAALYGELLAEELDPPLRVAALLGLARSEADRQRHDEAESACRAATELAPDHPGAFAAWALTLRTLGRLAEAADAIAVANARAPGAPQLLNVSAAIALERGRADEALGFAEAALAVDPLDQRALSDKGIALSALGRDEEAGALLDFDRLLRVSVADTPTGFASLDEFNATMVAAILAKPGLTPQDGAHTLVGGARLDDSFSLPARVAEPLHDLFLDATRDYAANVRPGDPAHPIMAGRPRRYDLSSWANVIDRAGFERPHIHESGWVSGVYYAEMPEATSGDDGAIMFGGHPYGAALPSGPTQTIMPKVGQLILFPSYFYHATIPFTGSGRRVSIAFDVGR